MEPLRKTIAAFFGILFVIAAVMALLFFNFDRRAFTAETYQQAFTREDFYNKLPNLMAKAIVSSDTDTSQSPLVMEGMGVEAWEGFIRALLPTDVLKSLGDDVLNSTFAYFSMETDTIQVSLAPVKTSMASEAGTQAIISLLTTLPACTFDQIARTTINLLSGGQIEFCSPPAEMLPLLTPVIQGQMQFAASIIPDRLTLATAPLQNDPRQRLQTIRFFMRLSPILPLMFLFGLTIFAVRSLNDWLSWWGIPLLITGFITFVMGILGAPIVGAVLERILVNRLPVYLPAFLLDFTGELAAAMARAVLNPVLWQGLVLLIIGGGMIGTGYLLKTIKT